MMSDWNPDAFPSASYRGMSLRDYFAGQALAGGLGGIHISPRAACMDDATDEAESAARWAYMVADAMLNHREATQ
jgi:hypothetical protein